ncbi:MAG: MFS transporter [Deltaproteobacteria bacterium]|nr:MFS transporter [Deltaproteobacteria bacterium]
MSDSNDSQAPALWGLSRYQWLVLGAAWLGWGFDIFDGLLFNFVSPLCVPSLLHLTHGSPEAQKAALYWNGVLTSVLLVGWAIGGVVFGRITDRLGRTRTLLLTMLTYALGTAACAFAPNLLVLGLFRFIASLGIGGEWAAGASLVAEAVPEKQRVRAGAFLYTSAPAGLFLAIFVNDFFTRKLGSTVADPDLAWRAVFLTGLLPAAVGLLIRLKVKEPGRWRPSEVPPKLAEIFTPALKKRTYSGLMVAAVAILTWWSCNAFLPVVARYLAGVAFPSAAAAELSKAKAEWVTNATLYFNVGGLIGTLLTIPFAARMGRRPLFFIYFAGSAISIWLTFGFPLEPAHRLMMLSLVGLTVFGVFGAFPFYLPELFPTRLRGTGAGFCYNAARAITAAGPFAVSTFAASGGNPVDVLRWVAIGPLLGVVFLFAGLGIETKGETLG